MSSRVDASEPRAPYDASTLPLAGVRVVELCHVAAGPFASMLLADLGADVVKIEGPTGDQMRGWPPLELLPDGDRFSHNFASVNRNKRSVVLDLKTEVGRNAAADLIAEADVVIENYRPGALGRLGLDYPTVSTGHRGLIYCSISGFGQSGPLARRGAYDVVIQGMSGLMNITGEPDGRPAKSGVPVADFTVALYAAYTVAALLPETRRTGRSHHVDCSMLDCLLGISALQTSEFWGSGREPARLGSRHPRNAPYQAFAAQDRMFVVAAGNNVLFASLCEIVGCPELTADSRFVDQLSRAAHQIELEALLAPLFATRPAAYWLDKFEMHGVPSGPLNTFGEILASDHVQQTGLVGTVPTSGVGTVPAVVFPVRIDGDRIHPRVGAPLLGEHTSEVLDALRASRDEGCRQ